MEKRDKCKNMIIRGIPDIPEINKNEKQNLLDLLKEAGCDDITGKDMAYVGRLHTKKQGPRYVEVEYNSLQDKMNVASWREDLLNLGVSFSNDYSFEEREWGTRMVSPE